MTILVENYAIPAEPVARGAQGAVYFGHDRQGNEIAIKVASGSRSARDALQREARVLKTLTAAGIPGIVELLDVTHVQDQLALVMPRYVGHLGTWIQELRISTQADTLNNILSRIASLAQILAAVHRVEVDGGRLVHRDIKPENIFFDAQQRLYIGDFGCALTIDGLQAVELALYGTPMWAPIDQFLPGRTIPDPTWDTYALCVMLYAALTGSRPAYQADPRELLTPRGQQLWELGRRAVADGPKAKELRLAFAHERLGASAVDLIDCTGRAALIESDRQVLAGALIRFAEASGLSEGCRSAIERGLWAILVRGLSPVSHPSPPNRFRDADELVIMLQDLRDQISRGITPVPARVSHFGPPTAPSLKPSPEQHLSTNERVTFEPFTETSRIPIDPSVEVTFLPLTTPEGPPILPIAIASIAITVMIGFTLWKFPEIAAWTAWQSGEPARITDIDAPFSIDRGEVTYARWAICADAGICSARTGPAAVPITGVTKDEAAAYCEWVKGHLPSQSQWIAAAGTSTFPWGEDLATCDHANAKGCGGALLPSGTTRAGATPQGVMDLAGNAWEWTLEGSLIGGGANSPVSKLGVHAQARPSEVSSVWIGFRCAYP